MFFLSYLRKTVCWNCSIQKNPILCYNYNGLTKYSPGKLKQNRKKENQRQITETHIKQKYEDQGKTTLKTGTTKTNVSLTTLTLVFFLNR